MTAVTDKMVGRLTRPIIGIERRTAQEAFDIMADRVHAALSDMGEDSTPTPTDHVATPRVVAPAEVYRVIKDVVIDKENVATWSRRIAAALSSPASPPVDRSGGIKPLNWDGFEARSPVGCYRVQRLDDKWEPLHNGSYMLPRLHGMVAAFGTVEEARASAEAHYQASVLSCLASSEGRNDG